MARSALTEELTGGEVPRAGGFIVTLYGDLVVPRGGVLWMGSLIDLCARVGISENLVRTAVSRLVAAGRLEGVRIGRRSFYRLAPAARREFTEAAQLLYAAEAEPKGWLLLHEPGLADEVIRRFRMARLSGDVWIFPDRGGRPEGQGLLLEARPDPGQIRRLAEAWDLSELEARYRRMLDRFGPLRRRIAAGDLPEAQDALMARLLLVHRFRAALLRDPCLPQAALPEAWPGAEARALFRALYLRLSPLADAVAPDLMENTDGALAAETPASLARLANLG